MNQVMMFVEKINYMLGGLFGGKIFSIDQNLGIGLAPHRDRRFP